MFARGIDPGNQISADALAIADWPEREAVLKYKKIVQEKLFDFLSEPDNLHQPGHPLLENGTVLWLILEHELMHQETLLYMLHQLPHELKCPPHGASHAAEDQQIPVEGQPIRIPAGITYLGANDGEFPYVWDNERPMRAVDVASFYMDAVPVTNGRFLEFTEADGYQNSAFWTPDTWQWKDERGLTHPFFWKRTGKGWVLRDLFDDIPLPLDWPVYVTHAEADAYARFIGQALPTEAEWHRAAFGNEKPVYPWGNAPPTSDHGNFDFQRWSATPVGQFPRGASCFGVHDLLGNGWEWTSTPFSGFEGFTPSAGYPEYSADFFDGRHYVVKGGSPFTDARLLRRSFRNWFYWHYPYAYTTFRCVRRNGPL